MLNSWNVLLEYALLFGVFFYYFFPFLLLLFFLLRFSVCVLHFSSLTVRFRYHHQNILCLMWHPTVINYFWWNVSWDSQRGRYTVHTLICECVCVTTDFASESKFWKMYMRMVNDIHLLEHIVTLCCSSLKN